MRDELILSSQSTKCGLPKHTQYINGLDTSIAVLLQRTAVIHMCVRFDAVNCVV
jgi:hypothetical protein